MAGNCPWCHRYLGSATTCPDCEDLSRSVGPRADRDPDTAGSVPFTATPNPFGVWEAPAESDSYPASFQLPVDPAGGPSALSGTASSFSLRGVIVGGQQIRQRFVSGAMPVRVGLVFTWAAAVYYKAGDLVASAFWSLFWTLLPFLLIWIVLGALASRVGLGGCLMAPLMIRLPRAQPRDDGWALDVQTGPSSGESVHVAGDVPVRTGDEVVVHGPLIGGVRHAWLIQGVGATTFTTVTRGLIGTIVRAAILVPQIVWLLLR